MTNTTMLVEGQLSGLVGKHQKEAKLPMSQE